MRFTALVRLVTFLMLTASCEAFDAEPSERPPEDGLGLPHRRPRDAQDGGGSVVGDSIVVNVERQIFIRGTMAKVIVTIERKGSFGGEVVVKMAKLPPGITVEHVTILPGETCAEVAVDVAATAAQGDVDGAMIQATSTDGNLRSEIPLVAFVRGRAGELDTTFGSAGIADPGGTYGSLDVAADGSFHVSSATGASIRRYRADGKLDPRFNGGEALGFGIPVALSAATATHLYAAGSRYSSDLDAEVVFFRRLLPTGAADATWTGLMGASLEGYGVAIHGLAVSSSGKSSLLGEFQGKGGGWRVYWYDETGGPDMSLGSKPWSQGNVPARVVRGMYTPTNFIAVGIGHLIGLTATGYYDATFTGRGLVALPVGGTAADLRTDSKGRILVGGTSISGAYVVRLTNKGALDTSFGTTGYAIVHGASIGGGYVAAQSDGKVLLLSTEAGRCAITRYLEDGTLDLTFGTGGRYTSSFAGCFGGQIALQPDGRILVSGNKLLRIWS